MMREVPDKPEDDGAENNLGATGFGRLLGFAHASEYAPSLKEIQHGQ